MYSDIKDVYDKAYKDINADILIPSGTLMEKLTEAGIEKVHRDTFHASLGLGRYALGLLWYCVLTGNDTENVDFSDFDEPVSEKEIKIVKECVKKLLHK